MRVSLEANSRKRQRPSADSESPALSCLLVNEECMPFMRGALERFSDSWSDDVAKQETGEGLANASGALGCCGQRDATSAASKRALHLISDAL